MARVKGGTVTRARRKKVLKKAEGYFGSKHRLYRTAQEQVMHSGAYSYQDRKKRKGDFRKLWITRINAAARENNISYSKLIDGLNKANININRKMLSELAIACPEEFTKLVNEARKALETPNKKETKEDISSLTVAQLKELAKEKNIEGYTTMKKQELLDALK